MWVLLKVQIGVNPNGVSPIGVSLNGVSPNDHSVDNQSINQSYFSQLCTFCTILHNFALVGKNSQIIPLFCLQAYLINIIISTTIAT